MINTGLFIMSCNVFLSEACKNNNAQLLDISLSEFNCVSDDI
ncbi:hypothetical protein AB82_4108 [Escherichia coli 2-005-03_S3_C1]|nr:hypothetical protein ECDEC15C_4212 [Escherichia coli DEC15C]KDW55353.1 hypothetical protein AB82_4108 [Escherichia coli 2-005-03_S3_C1]